MFRFTQEPSSGSYKQSLAKITSLGQLCVSYTRHVQLTKTCNFSWTLFAASWWWFLGEPKHVGAAFVRLIGFLLFNDFT